MGCVSQTIKSWKPNEKTLITALVLCCRCTGAVVLEVQREMLFHPSIFDFFRSSAFFDDNVYLLLIMRPVVLIGWEKCFSKWVNIIILHNISSEATWWYRLGLTQKLGSWRSYLSLKPGWCSWRRCSWMHMTKQVAMFQGHDKAVAGGRVGSLMITSN